MFGISAAGVPRQRTSEEVNDESNLVHAEGASGELSFLLGV